MSYTGTDDTRSLTHRKYKYIRKEYKNGYWRYYYEDDKGATFHVRGSNIPYAMRKYYEGRDNRNIVEFYADEFEQLVANVMERDDYGVYKNRVVHFVSKFVDNDYRKLIKSYAEYESNTPRGREERYRKEREKEEKSLEKLKKTKKYKDAIAKTKAEIEQQNKEWRLYAKKHLGKYKTDAIPR